MKPVTDTPGVARSNIAERVKRIRPERGPQTRDGDLGELIAWEATTAGISGERVRDFMVVAVERRFATSRAPHRVPSLSDNGSPYAAAKTIDLALALNLEPCFTPVESPESNGMAEAFVRTLKRDYVRVSPITDAATALASLPAWIDDSNDIRPHSSLAYRSPREYISQTSTAACPV